MSRPSRRRVWGQRPGQPDAQHHWIGGHPIMYQDKTLVCRDCGAEFVFTAGEQEFYAEKGFQNEPTRCKACRAARNAVRPARRTALPLLVRCMRRPALPVASPRPSPSFPRATAPSTAASASPLTGRPDWGQRTETNPHARRGFVSVFLFYAMRPGTCSPFQPAVSAR